VGRPELPGRALDKTFDDGGADAGAVSVLEICVLFVAVVVLLALVGVVSL
jgi:hypothetical protein